MKVRISLPILFLILLACVPAALASPPWVPMTFTVLDEGETPLAGVRISIRDDGIASLLNKRFAGLGVREAFTGTTDAKGVLYVARVFSAVGTMRIRAPGRPERSLTWHFPARHEHAQSCVIRYITAPPRVR